MRSHRSVPALVVASLTILGFLTLAPPVAAQPTFGLTAIPVLSTTTSDSPEDDPELIAAIERWWAKKKEEVLGGDFDLTFGAAIRIRAENRDPVNYALANSRSAEDYTLLRTKVHVGLGVNDHLGGFIQFRDSRTWGEESPNSVLSDSEGVDLHQGYIWLKNVQELLGVETPEGVAFTIRGGRIEFPNLGDQRMFSSLDWSNIARTFDGYHFALTTAPVDVHGVLATVTEDPGFNAGRDAHLYVIYVASRPADGLECDVYAAWRNYKTDSVTGEDSVVGDLEDQTYGARAAFARADFRAMLEAAFQDGKSANDDVEAYGWVAEAGYRAKNVPYMPGLSFGWTFASGDGNPTDGDENTFKPIAPFGHAYQGHYDIFAWQNGHDYYAKAIVSPCALCTVHADFHHFILDEPEDSWYNAGGVAQRTDSTGRSGRTIGSELDLYVKGTVSKRLKVWAGWSHFWRGPYVRRTGGGDTGNFLFFQGELLFGKS
ncbi:MAG: alginate export family protein [Planctomycetes bacterium]|nr:alginate export family protein [Planctomycetota bacterium]